MTSGPGGRWLSAMLVSTEAAAPGLHLRVGDPSHGGLPDKIVLEPDAPAAGGLLARPPLYATREGGCDWLLRNVDSPEALVRVTVTASTQVFDLGRWPCLVTTTDGYTLESRSPDRVRNLATFTHPIRHAEVSPKGQHIAVETAEGVWVVTHHGGVLRDPRADAP